MDSPVISFAIPHIIPDGLDLGTSVVSPWYGRTISCVKKAISRPTHHYAKVYRVRRM